LFVSEKMAHEGRDKAQQKMDVNSKNHSLDHIYLFSLNYIFNNLLNLQQVNQKQITSVILIISNNLWAINNVG